MIGIKFKIEPEWALDFKIRYPVIIGGGYLGNIVFVVDFLAFGPFRLYRHTKITMCPFTGTIKEEIVEL